MNPNAPYTPYAYAKTLSKEQWAWEFLRRNPDYRRDYKVFIKRWRALEADYGVAPNRDFSNWKNDPRATVNEFDTELTNSAASGDACVSDCVIDNGKILIECWMGAKWGFYKFPLAPDYQQPNVPDELLWREQQTELDEIAREVRLLHKSSQPIPKHYVNLHFDLGLSLKDQLKAARQELLGLHHQLKKTGEIKSGISDYLQEWTYFLEILDTGKNCDESVQAKMMCRSGYRKILMMTGP